MISLPDCDINSATIVDLYSVYDLSFTLSNATQCGDELSFFCNATLLLCNGNSSSVDLTEECEEVRDNKCASEWRIVESFLNKTILDCTSLSFTEDRNLLFKSAPDLPCTSQFDHFCGSTCGPVCGEFSFTEDASSFRFVIIPCSLVGLTGGIITLIVCFYYRKKVYVTLPVKYVWINYFLCM